MLVRFLAGLVLLVFAAASASSQQSTSSSYSAYGIGEVESTGFAQQLGMGDVKYGSISTSSANPANPASYSIYSEPLFDAGVEGSYLRVVTDQSSRITSSGGWKNMALVLPISKRIGAAIHVAPYSKIGYSTQEAVTIDTIASADLIYGGGGGINQLNLGLSHDFTPDSTQWLSVGVNMRYHFGSLEQSRRALFDDASGALHTLNESDIHVSDIGAAFGVLYRKVLTKRLALSAGITYEMAANLRAKQEAFTASYITNSFGTEIITDTVSSTTTNGRLSLPQHIGTGVQATWDNKLTLGIDYSHTAWSKLRVLDQENELRDRHQFAAGLQFVPQPGAANNLLKVMQYRAGIRMVNTQLVVNQTGIDEFGINFGLGIPLYKRSQSRSFIHLAFEMGRRGTIDNGLIREDFQKFNIGFTLKPSRFEPWFVRKKID